MTEGTMEVLPIEGVESAHPQNDVVKGVFGTCLALDDILLIAILNLSISK